jgi:hypothetical protein
MCAFLGRELVVHAVPLRLRVADAAGGVPPIGIAMRQAAPLAAGLRAPTIGFAAPAVLTFALPATPVSLRSYRPEGVAPPAALRAMAWEPPKAAVRLPANPPFVAPRREVPLVAAPRVWTDLAAARHQPVRRRMVAAGRLAPEEAAMWLRRLADAKRMVPKRLALVGVFPDLPIVEGAAVKYDAAAGAIAYPVPEAPVPLSTVVIATRTDTGATVVGRFYR